MRTSDAPVRARDDADAFTLVELLAVIAVVAVLASMLLPVLAGAKGRAQSVQCLGNLKQLQLAWQLYADDHDGRLVPNWYFDNGWGSRMRPGTRGNAGFCAYRTCSRLRPVWRSC